MIIFRTYAHLCGLWRTKFLFGYLLEYFFLIKNNNISDIVIRKYKNLKANSKKERKFECGRANWEVVLNY